MSIKFSPDMRIKAHLKKTECQTFQSDMTATKELWQKVTNRGKHTVRRHDMLIAVFTSVCVNTAISSYYLYPTYIHCMTKTAIAPSQNCFLICKFDHLLQKLFCLNLFCHLQLVLRLSVGVHQCRDQLLRAF